MVYNRNDAPPTELEKVTVTQCLGVYGNSLKQAAMTRHDSNRMHHARQQRSKTVLPAMRHIFSTLLLLLCRAL